MPYQLSNKKRYPANASIGIGPGFLDTRSEFASKMLEVIIFWTYAENLIGALFVKILGADASKHIDRFIQRASTTKYANMLLDKAGPRVSAEDMLSLRTIVSMYLECFEERNKFAHWICGVANQVPQGVLLVNPHYLWRHQVAFDEHLRAFPAKFIDTAPRLNNEKFWIYELQCFNKINEDLGALIKALAHMYAVQNSPHNELGSHGRAQIYAIPQFQTARAALASSASPKKTRSLRQRFARLLRQLSRAFREFFQPAL